MSSPDDKKLRSKAQIEMLRTGLLASDFCGFSKVGVINEICDLALKGLALSHVATPACELEDGCAYQRRCVERGKCMAMPSRQPAAPSSIAATDDGELKSLAGQAIEMAISALRDIKRRAPGTCGFFDYDAFIERELVPAMAMAEKDRKGCIGLIGLLAAEKRKVEELSARSAIEPPKPAYWAWHAKSDHYLVGHYSHEPKEPSPYYGKPLYLSAPSPSSTELPRRKGWNAGIERAAEVAEQYAKLANSESCQRVADSIRSLKSEG